MTHSRRRRRAVTGFTLIEVLLVLVILVILGSIVGVSVFGVQKQALEKAAKTQVESIESAIKFYKLNMNKAPESLDNLITQPSDDKGNKWKGPYWEEDTIPLDPWENEYQYEVNGADYKVWSMGPDGASGTEDDING
ncbi:type II secretion system protein GspG [Blastopirellula marina]|uniref:Type II secretion system core protein G n=1 Tax=Blastopirellula marina TaxID=124 RepID=A0A2S8EZT3_9BACT|nr:MULTISPECIES: type II secretion system major pseudopilin GspG [Pirellulaceae]PQO25429.1 type II secretion system protein GspG [Blastopirellula marina]RCS42393.1 type II secretion system protein GspG [Bremerella cremea]